MKKAAIMGWWYNQNYGSILTYYALNKYVQNKGYETVMIDGPLGYKNRSNIRALKPLAYNFYKKNNNKNWYKLLSLVVTMNLVMVGFFIFSGEPYKILLTILKR